MIIVKRDHDVQIIQAGFGPRDVAVMSHINVDQQHGWKLDSILELPDLNIGVSENECMYTYVHICLLFHMFTFTLYFHVRLLSNYQVKLRCIYIS